MRSQRSNVDRTGISPVTLDRRTVLSWLGSAVVLPLGAELLAACSDAEQQLGDRGVVAAADADTAGDQTQTPGPDASMVDLLPPVSDAGFPFQPGSGKHKIFNSWNVRTVDPQDLTKILASWTLAVDGLVGSPATYKFTELATLPRQDQLTDFHCVEGWSVYDVPWNGLHLSELFNKAQVKATATHVTFHTIDGTYNESLPLSVALEAKTMLGYGVAGATLPLEHGFPLRVVIPRKLGYKNAKYLARIELTDKPVNGYWVAAGYPYDGDVPKERLRPGKY